MCACIATHGVPADCNILNVGWLISQPSVGFPHRTPADCSEFGRLRRQPAVGRTARTVMPVYLESLRIPAEADGEMSSYVAGFVAASDGVSR